MSVSGLCQVCESRPAEEQCQNCGALVCTVHYNETKGLCTDCFAQADPSRQSDDVDITRL
ncbi:hypothetical protein [Natronorubrum sulfidifaciens]|uniref:HIT-type domain-containing protein n=1 Tax=Natronorubrum sulfidifaciens JCM 14089 TaxID=1230460 RepID=L9VY60_9EURY|nr:hypothetical protein [Natronorubrum sulfidifaciens]ELY42120.1 hypothetical protein C495_16268 [Natronorubrum sulfidifaciens JCM 14089]